MYRPVADEGHDFWEDLVKNYVDFNPMYIISISNVAVAAGGPSGPWPIYGLAFM